MLQPLVTETGEDPITPNPGVCFGKISEDLGMLETKHRITAPPPPLPPAPICATLNFVI